MHGAAVHYQLQLSWTCGSLSGLCTTPKCSLGCSSPPPCHASTPSRPHISGSRSRTSVPSLTRDRSPTTWSWSLWHFGQSKVHATIFTINVGRREAILILLKTILLLIGSQQRTQTRTEVDDSSLIVSGTVVKAPSPILLELSHGAMASYQ